MLRVRTVLAIFLVLLIQGCSDQMELHRALLEEDANQVIAELADKQVIAEKKADKVGITVLISREDMARSVRILQAAGLPRKTQSSFGEIFKKEGVISTPMEERARYLYALSQELENTLSQIDGVIRARVHIVLPERVAPGEAIMPSSAAVFIKYTEWLDPDIILPRVERMIAKSIPGLTGNESDKLAVVFVPGQSYEAKSPMVQVGPFLVSKSSAGLLWGILIVFMLLMFYFGVRILFWVKPELKTMIQGKMQQRVEMAIAVKQQQTNSGKEESKP